MAIYDRREHTIRTIEYAVPSGSAAGELSKAWNAALADYRQIHNLSDDANVSDDWLQVHAGDGPDGGEVVLRFEIREQVTS